MSLIATVMSILLEKSIEYVCRTKVQIRCMSVRKDLLAGVHARFTWEAYACRCEPVAFRHGTLVRRTLIADTFTALSTETNHEAHLIIEECVSYLPMVQSARSAVKRLVTDETFPAVAVGSPVARPNSFFDEFYAKSRAVSSFEYRVYLPRG